MKRSLFLAAAAFGWLVLGTGCAQPSGDELLELARETARKGDSRTATIHLRNLLREDSNNAAARFLLGEVMLAQGDPVEAEAAFRRALELGYDPVAVQLPLLNAIYRQGRFPAVIEQIQRGPQLEGDARIETIRLTAQSHRGASRPDLAEQVLRAELQRDPDSVPLRTDLASLLMSQNRLEDGRRVLIDVLTDAPDYAPALALRGTLEFYSGRAEDAERSLREAIERDGENGEAYFSAATLLVELLTVKGDLAGAEGHANTLVARFPSHPVVVTLKANLELRKGNTAEARRLLDQLLARVPDFGPANRLSGIASAKEGQTQQAEVLLQRALLQSPGDRRALLHLANLHLDQGEVGDALDVLASAIGADMPSSRAAAFAHAGAAAIRLNEEELGDSLLAHSMNALTGDTDELLTVSAVLINVGRGQRAQELLSGSQAVADAPWIETFARVLTLVQERRYDEADASAARLIELQPGVAWPLNLRGMIASSRQDLSAALGYFTAAVDAEPGYLPARLNRARLLVLEGKLAEAASDFRQVVETDTLNATALIALTQIAMTQRNFADARQWIERMPPSLQRTHFEGSLALAEGRRDEAADKLLQVFRSQPTSDGALQAFAAMQSAGRPNPEAILAEWVAEHPRDVRVNFVLGSLALQGGKLDDAIRRYEAVIEADPKHVEALNNLAWAYNERGNRSRALELAKLASEAAPDNPAIADTLGWLYVQNGQAREGLPLIERSHAAVPDHAEIHYHWAVALARTGDEARAATELRALLAAHAQFAEREAAERLLREIE